MITRYSFAADDQSDLRHITYVDGDTEYDYRLRRATDPNLVAIRTLSGEGALDVDGAGLRIVTGGSVLITELNRIRYYGTYERSWRFYWFLFSRGCVVGLPWDEVIPVTDTSWEQGVLEHVFAQLALPGRDAQASAIAFFRALLCHWTAAHAASGRRPHSASELVRRAVERFSSSGAEPLSMESLAAELGIGPRRLRQAFLQEAGRSPKSYYTTMRMRQAAQALRMGRGNVSEIAEQFGYASPFHFSRAFKAEFGCSPSRYLEGSTGGERAS
ncbi:MAG: AraC family transcriptional regulator [Capsulimonadaceae bacterium]|nr:AraC family transcriptional regulator [Capsulimonadaceae bacterium]